MSPKITAILVLISIVLPSAIAATPLDEAATSLKSQVVKQANITGTGIEQRAVERILEGNLTKERIRSDVNATKQEIKQRAVQKINQEIDNTTEDLQQKVKSELTNQVNSTAEQPGFEAAFALAGIIAACVFLRRRC